MTVQNSMMFIQIEPKWILFGTEQPNAFRSRPYAHSTTTAIQ
jgi:hypothetical protein